MQFIGRLAKSWFMLSLLVMGIYLTICNQDPIHLRFPPWIDQIRLPGYIVELGFFLLGALAMTLHFGGENLRKSLEIRRLKKKLRELGADDLGSGADDQRVATPSPTATETKP